MIKRTVVISSPGVKLNYRCGQLEIASRDRETQRVPCEDIGLLMLDHKQISYSHSAMVECMNHGAVVVFCAEDHHPAGMLLPMSGNTLHTERVRAQAEMLKPLKKQLWKLIIQAKLKNQAKVLGREKRTGSRIAKLADAVRSGDPDNCESQGARLYFPALFGKGFRREREGGVPNNLLNYGYMVIRATVARALTGSGLHPALGLFHRHRNNPFCLADDLMEPYRPYVDRQVKQMIYDQVDTLDRDAKKSLLALLSDPVVLASGKGPMMVAIQKSAASLALAIVNKMPVLELPKL